MDYKELMRLQLKQLRRLLETKRLKFNDAFYVIFSDYPSEDFLKRLLEIEREDNIRITPMGLELAYQITIFY